MRIVIQANKQSQKLFPFEKMVKKLDVPIYLNSQVYQTRPEAAYEGEVLASYSYMFLVEPDKLEFKRHWHVFFFLFVMHQLKISRLKNYQTNKKQMLFCTQELEVGPSATSSVQPLWANSPYRNGYLRFIYLDI